MQSEQNKNTFSISEHTPDAKIARAKMLRGRAALCREKAKNPRHPSDVGRLINDAATMEQNAGVLEDEVRRMMWE